MTDNTSMRTGALYIRVSTGKQEELSPDAQRRLLLDFLPRTISLSPISISMKKMAYPDVRRINVHRSRI